MSTFVDTMRASATGPAGSAKGMTTGEPHAPARRTWAQVHEAASRIAGALLADGLTPGSAVAVLAADPALIAPAVQAVWLSGGSVTMLHQPTPRTNLAEWAEDTLRVLNMIGAGLVLLGAPFDALAGVLDEHGVRYRRLDELAGGEPLTEPVPVAEEATALLQLTSGSTADPKAVRITHRNLMANMRAMVQAAEFDFDADTMVSWLPLFHDMGMVGFLTLPMTFGVELVKVSPAEFLGGPLLWFDLISRYRGTVTAAPNFAYAIAGRRLASVDGDDTYDLSSLRIALNGAEPIDALAVASFTTAGARFGMDPGCVFCAYGMAETTLGVSFAKPGVGLATDVVDAERLETERVAAPAGDGPTRAFPLLGEPLPGLEIRVLGEDGQELGEREVGLLMLRGESVTPGYLTVDGPVSTQDAEGWLDTGDEGYLVDGQVVVCGRRKDVIIMGGRNIYPTDIERAASSVPGVRAGNAVAVRLDAGTRRERFAVALESKLAGDPAAEKALRNEVTSKVVDAAGVRPYAVVVLAPGNLPKTPSGKLRRAAAGQQVAQLLAKD
ncbi:fatty acyl-AMP ligase [Kutzneria viridogrisea]|uniref:Fatty-acyl-CoA synthase n=2 Tax=Kutzneria TaxID=43356 RepID=A0ABR6BSD1_9PSEU|nr:fatty acyl-AMP ligase [Kutzneria albida]AHH94157.1 putative ligase [Kutzneria albida DSM 43870]MBA8929830.1 fatty-acyl-CoA synthase [Kutzneria viridogrisea]